jgi:capsule polysaccharide export protein KpsE/RkpR
VLVAFGGVLIKEGFSMYKWAKNRKKNGSNGKNVSGLLEDIKEQGTLMLGKIGKVEDGLTQTNLSLQTVKTEMVSFKEKCAGTGERIDVLDQRLFDHIKGTGGK